MALTWIPGGSAPFGQYLTAVAGNGITLLGGVNIIARSTDNGATWATASLPPPPGLYDYTIWQLAFDPVLSMFVAAVNDYGILWSTDGTSWARVAFPGDPPLMAVASDGAGKFMAIGGGTAFTSTNGTAWVNKGSSGINTTPARAVYGGGAWWYIDTSFPSHRYSLDDGVTWGGVVAPGDGGSQARIATMGADLYSTKDYGEALMRTQDYGATWDAYSYPGGGFAPALAVAPGLAVTAGVPDAWEFDPANFTSPTSQSITGFARIATFADGMFYLMSEDGAYTAYAVYGAEPPEVTGFWTGFANTREVL